MLQWMHDERVIQGLQPGKFRENTIEDCKRFIASCEDQSVNCHMAIVDELDVYQGTVSLKAIDREAKDAEFAIVLRYDAWGKGFAFQAMRDILKIAFEEYGLNEVYWNVLCGNLTARRLYDKPPYRPRENVCDRWMAHAPKQADVVFYSVTKEDFVNA